MPAKPVQSGLRRAVCRGLNVVRMPVRQLLHQVLGRGLGAGLHGELGCEEHPVAKGVLILPGRDL
ncbi:hypothetical protein ACFFX0_00285 [Citricoccus parietis]|uniref:Uncharacterized protein n=1 Tax=Citricoccus parietis TaxID=592307 RepID=A0ABV5FTY0_9MICC